MDIDVLVKEVYKRVQEKLAGLQPKLLLLTGENSCPPIASCQELADSYQLVSIPAAESACDLDGYEAVVACGLSNDFLGRIANGILSDGYTKSFGEALLSGKPIYLPEEEIELFKYKGVHTPYYNRLLANLRILEESGVKIIPAKKLAAVLCKGNETQPECAGKEVSEADSPGREIQICKRVITEKDIMAAHNEKANIIIVGERAIFTDLAKEYAGKQKISVIRRNISPA